MILLNLFRLLEQSWVKQGPRKDTFYVNHCQGTIPVLYNAKGWLNQAREHSTTKQARGILSESSKYVETLHSFNLFKVFFPSPYVETSLSLN